MRRLFVLFLVCMMVILSACSSNQSSTGSNGKENDSNVTTINFAAIKTFGVDSWSELIKKFEAENPDIKVKLTQMPAPAKSTEIHQYLVTAFQSGQSDIDVFTGDVVWVPEFAAAGWTEPMDQYVNKDEYYPGVIDALTYDGKLSAMPWYVDGGMLYYRKDLLEKYNKPVPTTWDELIKTSEEIKSKENNDKLNQFVWQGKQAEVLVCDFVEFLGSAGGSILDSNGKSAASSPEFLKTLEFMKKMTDDKISPKSVLTFDEEPSRTVFTDGNAIFHRNWSYVWSVAQDPKQSKVVDKVGVAPLPSFDGKSSASTMGGYQFMVSKSSKKKEAAVKFAQFLSSEESQLYYAKELAFSPTRPNVLKDSELQKKNPFLTGLDKVFQGTTARPVSPDYPKLSLVLQSNISGVLSGMIKEKNAAKQIDNELKKITNQ
ncbi:ABC transporter substrate-binding protein [Bacillus sp. ISL-40]|uniref:ABC transporter substrate-binding protein n=1 Tax=unclassified Bacillus (in: firmicutes) TaxID=185979 RepID=UPI001BEBE6CE|nr:MULTISPECIES: ABC transporter substrate-binding protein [unclassified Bacillus (in: firmicutes)]MBT2695997.1 ABC transporter substrate-binding protein [Bacillus sp. ISL-40]MBT2719531.1 ABC transporter substrate-binding protein [Bacillus sp. ISL-46]MBT2743888.1 ABC transporter substrate-binding protein [Bacillus sp. ISL-77]